MALAWIFERNKIVEVDCADRVLAELGEMDAFIPPLWHTEIANALLVGERRKVITEAQVMDYLARLDNLSITEDEALPSARRDQVMSLARQYHLTAYDATYLELALRKGAVLATFDSDLAKAMQDAGGIVYQ
jgi:predicted nucleic acid-binding protein